VVKVLAETDWLASRPVFYNTRTGAVSDNINCVIEPEHFDFDPEGLTSYLRFGYSVFERTPIEGVRFLPPSSRLLMDAAGAFRVESLADPVDALPGHATREEDVLSLLQARVQEWEQGSDGEILVPTSGGYDSRLLTLLLADKSLIRSVTYGLSEPQSNSTEVVYARRLSEIYGTKWEQIPLGSFHDHFEEWDQLFGVSTHAHGMYQLEFYHRVVESARPGVPLLSGIIGDVWAGSVVLPEISSPEKLILLGYTHGLHADPEMCHLRGPAPSAEAYFEMNRQKLADPLIRVIEAMRRKIILLSYMLRVPEQLGMRPWSPFLLPEIALAMLSLPPERRRHRMWQRDLFRSHGLDFEKQSLGGSRQNNLSEQGMRRVPLKPLDVTLLREVVRPDYIEWINRNVGPDRRLIDRIRVLQYRVPYAWGLLVHRFGLKDARARAYGAYLTLMPLESLLRRRNSVRNGGTNL
jgi:hypothetical protein